MIELAVQVIIRGSSASARVALQQDKLQGLGAVCRRGAVWVQGRVCGEVLAKLLGTSELPVVMASEQCVPNCSSNEFARVLTYK